MSKPLTRPQIAWRVAQDIEDGLCVNLGVGMPTMVSDFIPEDREVIFHAENGVLGYGPKAKENEVDLELINGGSEPVTLLDGGCYFHHADSFAMIRGGHIDITILGAYQVSEKGDLANWILPGTNTTPAIGGAMDLAVSTKKLFVMTDHCSRDGSPKIVKQCTLPLTALQCVTSIYTDLAIIDVTENGLLVREMIETMELETLQAKTGATIKLAENYRILDVPDTV